MDLWALHGQRLFLIPPPLLQQLSTTQTRKVRKPGLHHSWQLLAVHTSQHAPEEQHAGTRIKRPIPATALGTIPLAPFPPSRQSLIPRHARQLLQPRYPIRLREHGKLSSNRQLTAPLTRLRAPATQLRQSPEVYTLPKMLLRFTYPRFYPTPGGTGDDCQT